MTLPADPARTHALLVGIEQYAAGARWNLDGPVRDALAYHAWLVARGVPASQLITLLSPLPDNASLAADAGITAQAATAEGVRQALQQLSDRKGDLLIVTWSGHGVVNERTHRLFVADASENDKRNFTLDALRETLASSWFPGFPRQILIVDACANHQNFTFSLPSEVLPRGEPQNREQFVFFAAQRGQVAANLGAESRGLFSRELLGELQTGSGWPPDMRAVADKVQESFSELRATTKRNQTPVYEWRRDWQGNEDVMVASPLIGHQRPAAAAKWKLDFNQLCTLRDALLQCQRLSTTDSRNDLLADMRPAIRNAVKRRGDVRSDVMNILTTASAYPQGLEELLLLVRHHEGDSLPWQAVAQVLEVRFPALALDQPPADTNAQAAAIAALAQALADCPSLSVPESRDDLVAKLGSPIAEYTARRSELRDDLQAIVRTCTRFDGGITRLLDAVRDSEGESSQWPRVEQAAQALLMGIAQ